MDKDLQEAMTHVYDSNVWGSKESRSGEGSTRKQTMYIEFEVPALFDRLDITSVLDIPCGDFQWMSRALARCSDIKYHGADVVEELVNINKLQYGSDNVDFSCLDITSDKLPQADLIFTRDLLVHLTDEQVFKAFENIKASGAKYLATTHFNWFHIPNNPLAEARGGSWRKINLRMAPFNLPMPIDLISEGSSQPLGIDKTIGVWEVKDLP